MKKSVVIVVTAYVGFILLVFAIFALVVHSDQLEKTLTANDVYKQCLDNVIEIKATSKNIGESIGTGEIISADGKVITNAHVVTYTHLGIINEYESYYIRFSFEKDYRVATLEKYDSELDLAVLKINDSSNLHLTPIKIGNSDKLEAGDKVFAI